MSEKVAADILDMDWLPSLPVCMYSAESESELWDGTSFCKLGGKRRGKKKKKNWWYFTETAALAFHDIVPTLHHTYPHLQYQ